MQSNTASTTTTALVPNSNTDSPSSLQVTFNETEVDAEETTTLANANSTTAAAATTAATLPVDQERQVLLLMLLGQVCALHDPTPQTFTVHVLELVERGLLEQAAVSFLYDLGLVPSPRSSSSSPTATSTLPISPNTPQRAASNATATSSSSVQEHPLTLSRYQRDFRALHPIASGSFGSVVAAVNALDGATYAVKRVVVSMGSASDTILRTLLREVQCIAQCDHHPHVVRYYTAWLEPSWMTGDMTTTRTEQPMLLLTHGASADDGASSSTSYYGTRHHQHSLGEYSSAWNNDSTNNNMDSTNSVMSDWFHHERQLQQQYPILSSHDEEATSDSLFDRSDCTAWDDDDTAVPSAEEGSYQYDEHPTASAAPHHQPLSPASKKNHNRHSHRPYRYEVCLYIQMQLCDTTTLLDWMRTGPHDRSLVRRVIRDLSSGLHHIHQCGIVHRDIKPANIFRHATDAHHFLIGDFGLSTLVPRQQNRQTTNGRVDARTQPATAAAASGAPSYKHNSAHNGWHTAGVGTATYAAPEQVATRTYGPSADIFSFGLILLELSVPNPMTTTDHERMEVMGNVRHRRMVPEAIRRKDPNMADLILDCTAPEPEKRPTAADILKRLEEEEEEETPVDSTVRSTSQRKQRGSESVCTTEFSTKSGDNDEAVLRRRLQAMELQVAHYQKQLAERDATIAALQLQLREARKCR